MDKAERKDVTTNGSERNARRRPRARLDRSEDFLADAERSSALGLHDEALVAAALEAYPTAHDSHPLISELEQRFGAEQAAFRLSSTGSRGQALAIEHWGSLLHPSSFTGGSVMPGAMPRAGAPGLQEPRPLFKRRPGAASRADTPLELKRRQDVESPSEAGDDAPLDLQARLNNGRPLDPAVLRRMESRLGVDLSDVRVHTGGEAAELTHDLGARAFTVGSDIAFAAGEYRPGTAEGDRLLAHELTHVLQQRSGQVPQLHDSGEGADAALEQQADEVADRLIAEQSGQAGPGKAAQNGQTSEQESARDGQVMSDDEQATADAELIDYTADHDLDVDAESGTGDAGFVTERSYESAELAGAGEEALEPLSLENAMAQLRTFAASPGGAMPALAVQLKPSPGEPQEKGDEKKLSEEEINAEVNKAKTKGKTKSSETAKTVKPPKKAAPPKPKPEKEPKDTKAQVKPPTKKDRPQGKASTISGPASLSTFQQEKGGKLRDWDNELAWHDFFKNPQAGGGAGHVEIDRGALVKNALLGGAKEGALEGLKGLGLDIAINMASSKVPYLSGFVEMAKLAYDPKAYIQGMLQNTYGKAALGVSQIAQGGAAFLKGDMWAAVDVIEGVLNVADGLNNVIATISSILWIVAAAGFILSFICPALIPFVGLAAQWAYTLGGIGTLIGLFITAARALVMGLRALQILYGNASPEDTLAQGERLRAQTTQFTQEFTQNAGNSIRNNVSASLKNKNKPVADGPDTARTTQVSDPPKSSTRMQKVLSLMSGMWGSPGEGALGGFAATQRDVSGRIGTAKETTKAFAGTGEYSGGATRADGKRTTGQQIADMESAGANMFHSDKQRQKVMGQLKDGKGIGTKEGDHNFTRRNDPELAAVGRVVQAEENLKKAKENERSSREELQKARSDLKKAKEQLELTRQQHAPAIDQAKQDLSVRRELQHEAAADVRLAQHQVQYHQDMVDYASAMNQAHPSPQYAKILAESQANLAHAQESLQAKQKNLSDANDYVREGESNLSQAMKPVNEAEQEVSGKQQGYSSATGQYGQAVNARSDAYKERSQAYQNANAIGLPEGTLPGRDARGGRIDATRDNVTYQPPPGGLSRDAHNEQQDKVKDYNPMFDWSGEGPSSLHGHNQASGVLGGGTDLAKVLLDEGIDAATAEPGARDDKLPMGVWSTTLEKGDDGKSKGFLDMDTSSTAGGREDKGEKKNYEAQLKERFETIKASLKAPPLEAPDKVDETASTYHQRVEEEKLIKTRIAVLEELQAEGKKEIDALKLSQEIAKANEEAAVEQDKKLEDKIKKQDELRDRTNKTREESETAKNKSEDGSGEMGGMMSGGLMKIFSLIPSRLSPGGGAGAGGAKKLEGDIKNQGKAAGEGLKTTDKVSDDSNKMTANTQQGRNVAGEVKGGLTNLQGKMSGQESEANQAMVDVGDAMDKAHNRMGKIAGEKTSLRTQHDQAIAEMSEWISVHQASRNAGMGELDGIVKLIESGE